MVFFTDKDTTSFNFENPVQILSPRSIERRQKQSIDISPQDFPVNPEYVNALKSTGADIYFTSKWFNAALVQMDESLANSIYALDFVSNVEYVAPGELLTREKQDVVIPEEFLEPPMIVSSSSTQLEMLNADKMQNDGFMGQGMLIAVFDAGFTGSNMYKPFEHVFDRDKLLATRDFVGNTDNVFQYNSHGTSVFSCIGAKYKNDLIGTAPEAEFVLCVTEAAQEYRIEEYNWLLAAEYADSLGVDVINSSVGYSYGFSDSKMDYSLSDLDGKTTVITKAAEIASQKGMIVVTSAGNEGRESNSWRKITAPADAENIITVGSVDKFGERSSFSSIGPTFDGRVKPDVMAMGSSATIMQSSGNITSGNGTSYSSPIMAGFVACIWQANLNWSNIEVMDAVRKAGNQSLSPDTLMGYGIPNYNAAVHNGVLSLSQLINTSLNVYPNPFTENKITIDFLGFELKEPMNIELTDASGNAVYKQKVTKRHSPDQIDLEFDANESGVYFLILRSKSINKVIKLIKI